MKIHLTLPIPNESVDVWNVFSRFAIRFLDTLRKYDAGEDYSLHLVYTGPEPPKPPGFKDVDLVHYPNQGWDIGAAQWMAHRLPPDDFVVSFTTRSYFHQRGWLKKIMDARREYGPGLYGTSASNQIRHHICVRSYGLDVRDYQAYPATIDSRAKGPCFETGVDYHHKVITGIPSITNFCMVRGLATKIVRFDGVFSPMDSIGREEGFRNGGQSQMLCWDKHSDIYAAAHPGEKYDLERLTIHG